MDCFRQDIRASYQYFRTVLARQISGAGTIKSVDSNITVSRWLSNAAVRLDDSC